MATLDSGWCDQAERVQYSFSQTLYISSMKLQVHVLLEYSRYPKVIHILAETPFDRYATISPFYRTRGICEKCRAGRALTSAERSPVSQRRRGYRGGNSDRKNARNKIHGCMQASKCEVMFSAAEWQHCYLLRLQGN
jgi:hypothetical protein